MLSKAADGRKLAKVYQVIFIIAVMNYDLLICHDLRTKLSCQLFFGSGSVKTGRNEDSNICIRVALADLSYKAPKSGAELVQDALEHPIGTPRLCDMAAGKKKIVVISSDHTRPVPSHIMMPLILAVNFSFP